MEKRQTFEKTNRILKEKTRFLSFESQRNRSKCSRSRLRGSQTSHFYLQCIIFTINTSKQAIYRAVSTSVGCCCFISVDEQRLSVYTK